MRLLVSAPLAELSHGETILACARAKRAPDVQPDELALTFSALTHRCEQPKSRGHQFKLHGHIIQHGVIVHKITS